VTTATLVLVHTIPDLVRDFARWCGDELPGVRVLHVLDEPMLERIKQRGHDGPEDDEHLLSHLRVAEDIAASALLVTCSTVSRAVARVRDRTVIPLFAIDDAMAREAVAIAGRVTIIATASTTLEPSRALVEAAAARAGRRVDVGIRFVDGALPALLSGDAATHDRLLVAAIRESAEAADVVVLAQATMARVLPALEAEAVSTPVLTSPQLALADVRAALRAAAAPPRPPAQVPSES
jgi:Asp/Glu/hydantoin racemase